MQSAEEQQRLLSLAQAEGPGTAVHDKVVSVAPDWSKYEQTGLIPAGSGEKLKGLHKMLLAQRSDLIEADPGLSALLLKVLDIQTEPHPVQYALTVLFDVVRDDTNKYDTYLRQLSNADLYSPLIRLLDRTNIDSYTADKAAYMLSGFMCRAQVRRFSDDQVKYLVQGLANAKFVVTEVGRLEAFGNILKIDAYRQLVWETRGAPDLIFRNLDPSKPAIVLYKAAFCVWLLSFNKGMLKGLIERGAVKSLRLTLSQSRVEKVVRVCIHTLNNLMVDETAMEQVVELNTLQVMQLLEYEKWRDQEMYDEIREGIHELQSKIKVFSNFERYDRELDTGKLRWSFLHSEKFWHENVRRFEDDEFKAVKKLAGLLKVTEPQTLAVACHDLGEFARLHPMGKKVCQKLGVKELTMVLMSHSEREVAREALLSVQKLMLERWQDVGATDKK